MYVHGDVAPFLISVHAKCSYQAAIVLLFELFPLYHESTALTVFFSFLVINVLRHCLCFAFFTFEFHKNEWVDLQ